MPAKLVQKVRKQMMADVVMPKIAEIIWDSARSVAAEEHETDDVFAVDEEAQRIMLEIVEFLLQGHIMLELDFGMSVAHPCQMDKAHYYAYWEIPKENQ